MSNTLGSDACEVLDFWLNDVGPSRWYKADPELDKTVRERFLDTWQNCLDTPMDDWRATSKGMLALLIVLDQFPRNMFRGTPMAHASDTKALAQATLAIARGDDLRIDGPERQFFYTPFMHAESLSAQARCIRLIMLRLENNQDNLKHANMHREVIRRFGRFPSRNAALYRNDTEAERRYRAEGGYMG